MHVIVTGLPGFAGSFVAGSCLDRGWQVTGISRRPLQSSNPVSERTGFHSIVADIAGMDRLPLGVDAVIHAAASLPFRGCSSAQLLRDNVLATQRLADLAVDAGVRTFVFFSSTSVFGREHRGIVSDRTAPIAPDVYGMSKSLCEQLLSEQTDRIASVCFRLPGIVGPGAGQNWIATVMKTILRGQKVEMFNPQAEFNSAVHIDDVMELAAKLILRGVSGSETAILAPRDSMRIRDVVGLMMETSGRRVPTDIVAASRPTFTLNCEKAVELWDWSPSDLHSALSRYVADEASRYHES